MFRYILTTLAVCIAISAAYAALATVALGACATRPDGECIPRLTALERAPDYVRAMHARSAPQTMPKRMTDLHAYGYRGAALVQRYNARANAYEFRAPNSGRLLAAYDRTNHDWYAFGLVIVAGWEA